MLAAAAVLAGAVSAQNAGGQTQPAPPRYEYEAQFRVRVENRYGAGENAARQDGIGLSRLYLGFTARPSKSVRVYLQGRDARVFGLAPGRSSVPFQSPMDLRQAYADLGSEDGPATLRVGRTVIDVLDARMLGGRDWSNTSPTFDGSMLTLRRGADSVTLLGVSQVTTLDSWDVPSRTRFLYGAIGSLGSWSRRHLVEPFVFVTRRPLNRGSNLGGLLRSVGTRFTGRFEGGWEYQVQLVGQTGGEQDLAQRAWMGIWEVDKAFANAPWQPAVGLEWSYASGDADPLDGRNGTFDTLFPSPHGIYGEVDVASHRNIRILEAGLELHPDRRLRLNLDYLDFRLASLQDGLYALNFREVVAPPPGGAASGDVGSELDLIIRYRPIPRLELRFGISRFFAGQFVVANAAGGESQTFLNAALTVEY